VNKSGVQICQGKVKAAHRYEVVKNFRRPRVEGMRFHFIGVGGIGMSALAKLLVKDKAIVSGSDQTQSPVTEELMEIGCRIVVGHARENMDARTDAVVVSAAVNESNPELRLARQRGYKIYKYAQMLGELMGCYDGIAVSGTHGKSTTAGWLAYCMRQAGRDVSFIVGAQIPQFGSNSRAGNGRYFIAEACEYDRSFLNLKPRIGCVLNIEADHLDYYKDEQEIVEAFGAFTEGIKRNGVLIANGMDSNVRKVIGSLSGGVRCETFGLSAKCSFYARGVRLVEGLYTFDVYHNGELLGSTRISLPGQHNILNALAVIAMAVNAKLEAEEVLKLLPGFTGIDRRLMLKAEINQIRVLDDYAHHPTEIKASLRAIRQRYNPRRLWCVFQPHQYSRTRFLLDDFAESFKLADVTIVPEIYFVRDTLTSKKEINAQMLVERLCDNGTEAVFIDSFDKICDYLKENVACGDLVVTMGAGDIWKVADEYIHWLRGNR